jgi:hypothetical protein
MTWLRHVLGGITPACPGLPEPSARKAGRLYTFFSSLLGQRHYFQGMEWLLTRAAGRSIGDMVPHTRDRSLARGDPHAEPLTCLQPL